jgi:hypothetical protein
VGSRHDGLTSPEDDAQASEASLASNQRPSGLNATAGQKAPLLTPARCTLVRPEFT